MGAAPVATGTAQVSPSASLTTVGLADASIPAVAGGYAGAGRYVANSAGVVHVAKREAEAEADADAFYGVYGYAGYPYASTYGAYSGYAGHPYAYGAYSAYAHPYSYAPYAAYTTAAVAAPAVTKVVEATPVATVAAAPVATVAAAPAIAAAPVAYAHHVAAPVVTGTAQVSPSASLTTVGLADASIPAVAGGYAGAGRYVANSAGVVHVAKREAEAE